MLPGRPKPLSWVLGLLDPIVANTRSGDTRSPGGFLVRAVK
jgi:hypothetical protein